VSDTQEVSLIEEPEPVQGAWFARLVPVLRGKPLSQADAVRIYEFITEAEWFDHTKRAARDDNERNGLAREQRHLDDQVRAVAVGYLASAALMLSLPPDVLRFTTTDGAPVDLKAAIWTDFSRTMRAGWNAHGWAPKRGKPPLLGTERED
jgi:hypothetical protein